MRVDPGNAEQLSAWDGDQGAFWVSRADRFNEGVARYHDQLLDAAGISPSETVLDIGCGSGQTTRDAARRASTGSAMGIDLSSSMIELAATLAEQEGVANAGFVHGDAQVYPFPDKYFDVALSRHGVMFFADPVAAFTNIGRALRPGGRLALLTWQPWECNEWISTFRSVLAPDSEAPPRPAGSLTDPDQSRDLLASAGFPDAEITSLVEPMYFGRDPDDAYQFISGQFAKTLEALDPLSRSRAESTLRTSMTAHHTDSGVLYNSAAWLIQARRP